ncbi:VOC family protein [Paenalkalicoccus suaedae]|uniref:VOC family protein n=1 Tax=Paenalkalicoccus suaedae TaxID=2592382 RepID=A0A859FBM0_9BACI|nr:VOC family protein [Paenalkalicoccus suaedae]QKS70111.1 VOC family protein [Paenalkalicoccus suaedae]
MKTFHAPPATFIHAVTLKVTDLRRSLDFYTDIMGFSILEESEATATLTVDGVNPIVTLVAPENVTKRQPNTTGLYHIAYLLPDRASVGRLLTHIADKKYPLQGASDHEVSEAVYLADPDGNGIEFYADRDPAKWEWQDGQIVMGTNRLDVEDILQEAGSEPFDKLPSNTIIGHVHLQVANLEEAEQFYRMVGFEVVTRYGDSAAFLSTASYHHHIGLNTWAGTDATIPPSNATGLAHIEIAFPNEEALMEVYTMGEEMENQSIVDPGGTRIKLNLAK